MIRQTVKVWVVTAILSGCNQCSPGSPNASDNVSKAPVDVQSQLVERGKGIYQANCTACHNSDPQRPGSIGPEVQGSSRELLEARILRAEYPAGYKPKRASKAMAALPHLGKDLDALHAYLNAS